MHERAQELLRNAGKVLTVCQQDFEAGRFVDIRPMENIVQEFCGILQKLPKDEALLYEEPLTVMVEGLESLEVMLTKKRDILKDQVQSLNANQKAQSAYKKYSSTNDNE